MNKTLVIIPSFNNLKLINKCLICLEKQINRDFDILVVDNGSKDDVVFFLDKWREKDSRHHVIYFDSNCGFAKACNKGFQYSIDNGYDYSLLLNNDAFVEKDFVSVLENAIDEDNKYFAINSLMISYKDPTLIDDLGDNYCVLGYAYQNKTGLSVEEYAKDTACFSACGGASIYNNVILKKIGLLDEIFFAYLEDIDLSYRARLHGYKIKTCIDAKCYHVGSATSGSKYNKFKVRLSSRNNIFLVYKNMPILQILINATPLFLGTFAKFIFFLVQGFGVDYIRGIVDAFLNIKYIERQDFRKINPINIIAIEIMLVIYAFTYVQDVIVRHMHKKNIYSPTSVW